MKRRSRARRGRRPSIAVAADRTRALRRSLKALMTETSRLEDRLRALDRFYRTLPTLPSNAARVTRRRGPSVRDVAYEILSQAKKPLPIQKLAPKIARRRKGRAGAHFVQNLGAALGRDRRFRRVGRGIYGVRKRA